MSTRRCGPAAPCNAEPLFSLGQTVATSAARALLVDHGVHPSVLLARHQCGDWGDVGADSVADNRRALLAGERLLSVYRLLEDAALAKMTLAERRKSPTVWIVTEADRWSTTILTPRCY
ncbi:MAG: type I restriction endonuclease subunit M [Burkholderiales bacterium]|nr:MAG: type I restriction endonuclease subunit M [Burkholderiales bacterium]